MVGSATLGFVKYLRPKKAGGLWTPVSFWGRVARQAVLPVDR